MNDATTNKSPSPSCDDGTSGQDLRLGRVEVVRGNERRACGNAEDADRRNAIQRQDAVNHPAHYTSHPSGVECIQITEHMGFNLGNAVKYIWRSDLKADAIEDLKKAKWYIERELKRRTAAVDELVGVV